MAMVKTGGVRILVGYFCFIGQRVWTRRSCQKLFTALSRLEERSLVPRRSSVLFRQSCTSIQNPWKVLFAAAGLMASSTSATSTLLEKEEATSNGNQGSNLLPSRKPRIVFVLGGPGSGKGTQCAKVVEAFGLEHLSAGDLLRAEIDSGSETGAVIQRIIKDGNIVPSEVTVKLIQKAMERSKTDKFLIDGFPRNEENRVTFQSVTHITPEFVLFLDCPEEEMERRILGRNQGRLDDNVQTIRRRFQVFLESSLPVVEYYESLGKVKKVNASRSVEDVFNSIRPLFEPFIRDDLLLASQQLLDGIDKGDFEVYKLLCDPHLTAFEPESQGQLVEGLQFHKYYFDQKVAGLKAGPFHLAQSTISAPKVTIIGTAGLVTYSRLMQKEGTPLEGDSEIYNETRVWEWRKGRDGVWGWKHVHFHRSRGPASGRI